MPSRARPALPLLHHLHDLPSLGGGLTPARPVLGARVAARVPSPALLAAQHRLPGHHAAVPGPPAADDAGAPREGERGDGRGGARAGPVVTGLEPGAGARDGRVGLEYRAE